MKFNKIGVIIGTQKGGTTSLFNYLCQHPQISGAQIKETNFFWEDHKWDRGLEYYESLYEWNPQQHLIALEASPNYTNSLSNAAKVIQRLQSIEDTAFKLIYILRSPIKKIESMRQQGTYQGWYSKFLERETPDSVPPEVIERICYATIADQFVHHFSRDHVLLLKTDELTDKENSISLMEKVCDFLEIDSTFQFSLDKVHNSKNSYRKDTLWSYLRDSKRLRSLKNIIPDQTKNYARGLLSKPLSKKETVPPLTESQKAFILDNVQGELLGLETNYGLDLTSWNAKR